MSRVCGPIPALCALLALVILAPGCPPVPPGDKPNAAFTASPVEGYVPLEVQFNDTSWAGASPIVAWRWDFGNGHTNTHQRSPKITYLEPGEYTVSLTVTTARGGSTLTKERYIVVRERTSFQAIGPEGGSVESRGLRLTVLPAALEHEVVYGLREERDPFLANAFEPMIIVSSAFTLTHNNASPRVFASVLGDAVRPAILEIPFVPDGVPPADRIAAKIQILARLENGLVVPIPGEVIGNKVVARVMRLPGRATYAVAYRPDCEMIVLAVPEGEKAPTLFDWADNWRIFVSREMGQQLTALRLGTIENTAPYYRRNFSDTQLQATAQAVGEGMAAIHAGYAGAGMRSPALVTDAGAYTLILYNMSETYPETFPSFQRLACRDTFFGHIVVDPRQLIAVSARNARDAAADEGKDLAQEYNFANAFAQTLMEACFDGYDYPKIAGMSPGDRDPRGNPTPVDFLAGLRTGLGVYAGQVADGLPVARGFEPNEYVLLSHPLFFPFDFVLPGYAAAGQEFFFYVQNRYAGEQPLQWIAQRAPLSRGILEEIRASFAAMPHGGARLSFEKALEESAKAVDRAMRNNLGISLSKAYWDFARDRAVENMPEARLRPSDAARDMFALKADRFAPPAVITKALPAPSDRLLVTPASEQALRDIAPLSSRAVRIQVNPLATELILRFNADEWEPDAHGNSLGVAVYLEGMPGLELATNGLDEDEDGIPETLIVNGFTPHPEDCYDTVTVLVSNLSLTARNSVSILAHSFAELSVDESDVLDLYVNTCDPNYDYFLESSASLPTAGVTSYVLNMTSGAWRGAHEVVQPLLWRHYVTIVEPPVVLSDTALLMVTGGSVTAMPSPAFAQLMLPFSLSTGSVVAVIQTVPNQPTLFVGETRGRSEDAIIAYSYDKYMNGFAEGRADMTWPALLPMTRAAVRAMDSIQDFMLNQKPGAPVRINNFVVTGASKRGWTTWLSAATDPRVTAIMPIVIDVLNMEVQMAHHYSAYGFYSSAIQDYVDMQIFERFGLPEGDSLLKIVDPYQYRRRLTMPKMIINSTGDQFFLPDSSRFYLGNPDPAANVPGENNLYYAPNTDHGLSSSDRLSADVGAYNAMLAFYNSFLRGVERPTFHWTVDKANGTITVYTEKPPRTVKLWQATNRSARDFRLATIGEAWSSIELTPYCEEEKGEEEGEMEETAVKQTEGEEEECDSGVYVGTVEIPEEGQGWTAFFIQLIYPGPDRNLEDVDFAFSTEVVVVPDVYPPTESR